MSRCNIERLQDGRRKVSYTPVEVGIFTITITWNGREIPGILDTTRARSLVSAYYQRIIFNITKLLSYMAPSVESMTQM